MEVIVTKTLRGTRSEFIGMIKDRMTAQVDIAEGKGRKRPQKEREAAEQVAIALDEVIQDLTVWEETAETMTVEVPAPGTVVMHTGTGPAAVPANLPSSVRGINNEGAGVRS